MKQLLKRLGVFFLGFVLGMLFFAFVERQLSHVPFVEVTLKNDSGKKIDTVRLSHENRIDENGIELVENIQEGGSVKIRFYAAGETSYKLLVTFSDGKKIAGGAGYAESGYKITETISDKEIKHQYSSLGY